MIERVRAAVTDMFGAPPVAPRRRPDGKLVTAEARATAAAVLILHRYEFALTEITAAIGQNNIRTVKAWLAAATRTYDEDGWFRKAVDACDPGPARTTHV